MQRNLKNDIKNLAPVLLPAGYFITSIGFWKIGNSDDNMGISIVVIGLVFALLGIAGLPDVNKEEIARINADKEALVKRHDEVLKSFETQAKEINGLKEDFKAIGKQIEELKSSINGKSSSEELK